MSPVASKPDHDVAYVTDVEGSWERLASFCANNVLVTLENDRLRVKPASPMSDDGIPLFDASQIRVGVRGRTVRLTGWVPSASARDAAEWDAWYVFGVDDVINEIETGA